MAGPPTSQTCGPATMVRLLKSAVARPGRTAAARKLKGTPGPGPHQGACEYELTVDDRDSECESGRTVTAVRHQHARGKTAPV